MKNIIMIGLMALALTGCKKDYLQEEFKVDMEYIKSKIKPDTTVRKIPTLDTVKYIQR